MREGSRLVGPPGRTGPSSPPRATATTALAALLALAPAVAPTLARAADPAATAPLATPTVTPAPAPAPAAPSPAVPDEAQDIRVAFEGYLLDQTDKKVVVRLSFELPGFEWIDVDGTLALELEPGRGKVHVTGPDGAERELDVTARLTRFLAGKGPLTRGPQGQRRWPLRGDLYLQARGEKLVELEMGGEIELPPHGQSVRYAPPEALPGGEGAPEAIGRTMLDVHKNGTGGGLLLGAAAWGRPAPRISYMGVAHIVHVETKKAKRGAHARDADRLLGRLAYVRDDYARAVEDGVIVNDAEYGEQNQLAREAILIADRLRLPAPLREKVAKVRSLVEWRRPTGEVAEACRAVSEELTQVLVFATTPPEPAPLAEARALFADNCSRCHGDEGDGKGPAARDLDPPPRDFHEGDFLPLLSPQRAFAAISSGVAATGMPAFESLDARSRWTLAFFVYGFRHRDPAAAEAGREALRRAGVGLPPLDDLAAATDVDLQALLRDRLPAADLPAAIAHLRTTGVDEAARNPIASVKAAVRSAVAAYSTDPARAETTLAAATTALQGAEDAVRIRDADLADAAARAAADLAAAVRGRAPEGDVEALARSALAALRPAEIALGRPAPPRGHTALFAAGLLALAASIFAVLRGRALWLRLRSSSGPVLSEKAS